MCMLKRWLGRTDAAATVVADTQRLRRLQWRVFLAITLGYGMFYVCRLSLNVAKKPLIDQGLFDAAQLGQIGSALFFMYAAGRLFNGAIADHAHVGRFMALGLCVSALAQLFLGTLPAFTIFVMVWGLNGWAQSMGVPASVVAMSRWFAKKGRGSVYGVWSISHNIGEAFTFLVTAAVVAQLGVSAGFEVAGCIGLVAAGLLLWALLDRPEAHGLMAPREGAEVHESDEAPSRGTEGEVRRAEPAVASSQWQALRNSRLWWVALASASFYVTRYALTSWGVFFLQESKGYSTIEAAAIVSSGALAGVVGTFSSGLIADRWFDGHRHRPALLFGLMYVASTAAFLWGPADRLADTVAMVSFGIAMGALLAYLGGMIAMDLVDRQAVGFATGIVGMASYLGAGLQDLSSGALIQAGHTMVNGRSHYDFSAAALFWVGAAVVAVVLAQCSAPRVVGATKAK